MASEDIYSQHTTPDTASAALTTLFASTQEYPHLELAIDPSLQSAAIPSADASTDDKAAPGSHGEEDGTAESSGAMQPGVASGGDDGAADGDVQIENSADVALNPPVRRKATSRINMLPRGGACEFCKRRKLKCTAEQPQCHACARSGRECVYSQRPQRSRVRVLEDKLVELERRLDHERQTNAGSNPEPSVPENVLSSTSSHVLLPPTPAWMSGSAASSVPSVGADPTPASTSSPAHPVPFHFFSDPLGAPSTGVEFSLTVGADAFRLGDLQSPNKREPDLMTLADAAAGDSHGIVSWPWEGMTAPAIASEVYKAIVENDKGIGEKIIAHLLQAFARPPHSRWIHMICEPHYFFDRLIGNKGQPPHPALIAAMIPNLFNLSTSPTLKSRDVVAASCDVLFPASRTLAQHALSTLDSRVLDLVVAATLRSEMLAAIGRFVDSWNENSTTVGLTWSTGIGKLGNVLEAFAPPELRPADRSARHAREKGIRAIRGKGQIFPPPADLSDATHRIQTFWGIFIADRVNGIGWNWPGVMDYTEITTPLPRDSYETPADLIDNTTLESFMSGRITNSSNDSILCLMVKSTAILYEASRLLDKDPVFATPDKTAHLLRISKRMMATMPQYRPTNREEAMRFSPINDVWMTMHTAMMYLHGKDEVDAASAEEAAEALDKGVDSALKMCDCVDRAVAAGDTELLGCDILALTMWGMVGRTMHHYTKRLDDKDPIKSHLLRTKIQMLIAVSRTASEHLRLAEVYSEMLPNITLGVESMLGEYERPDNTDILDVNPSRF